MSCTVVNDVSMLFDESNVAIIPLNKDFEPDFEESKVYTTIFKVSYGECKREFMYSDTPRRCYTYPIGKDKYIVYLVDVNFSDDCIKELISVIRRYLSDSPSISILMRETENRYIKTLFDKIPFDFRVYNKALCM